jgi:hypothetical protein
MQVQLELAKWEKAKYSYFFLVLERNSEISDMHCARLLPLVPMSALICGCAADCSARNPRLRLGGVFLINEVGVTRCSIAGWKSREAARIKSACRTSCGLIADLADIAVLAWQ